MNRELRRIFAELTEQGFRTTETKKGWIVYPPDPSRGVVVAHSTPSDHRAIKNFVGDLKRAGFEPPKG